MRCPAAKRRSGSSFGNSCKRAFDWIAKGFAAVNRLFDVFRKGEASVIVVNTALCGVAVSILLIGALAMKPSFDSNRAVRMASDGNAEGAVRILRSLENNGYAEEKLLALRFEVAEGLADSGRISEASSIVSELPAGEKKAELEKKCSYAQASLSYDKGEYTAAAQVFYQLGDYSDSASRYADCRCALAIQAWQSGDESAARSLLLDVQGASQRIEKVAAAVTGSEEAARQVLSAEIFSTDNLSRMEQTMAELKNARGTLPQGRVAAGLTHTVALRSDGTVLAAGDNIFGQCNVNGLTGVSQLAAGAYHTVALHEDGKVTAIGNNAFGQCDVSGWTNIVAVAAAAYDTLGLKSDGTVVSCGTHADKVSGWRNVTAIAGGGYSMGCLYDSGSMLSTHAGAQMDMGLVLYDLSVCGQVSVGVLYDGTMVSSFDGAPDWTEMLSVTAFESGILGVDAHGGVRYYLYREGESVELTVDGDAVEAVSSGKHHVILTSDGRVFAYGDNSYGQCDVSGWQL